MTTLSPSSTSNHLLLWTNAAFDDTNNPSRPPLHPINTNSPTNRDPRSPAFKKPSKMLSIDDEIDEAEREICRLSARVELLRTKKAEMVTPAKFLDPKKAGRVVPAKFLEPKKAESSLPAKFFTPKKGFLTPDAKKVVGLAKNLNGSAVIKKVSVGNAEEKVGNADERDFLEPKKELLLTYAKRVGNSGKNLEGLAAIKKLEESPASHRRGSSLVQAKIQNHVKPAILKIGGIQEEKLKGLTAGPILKKIESSPVSVRRGKSLGPMEIQRGKLAAVDRTPERTVQRSRMSAVQKLRAIEEEKVSNAEQRGLCLRAKSGPSIARAPEKLKTLAPKKIEESPASARVRRRGLSLGPMEIHSTRISKQKVGNAGNRVNRESKDGLKKVVVLSPAYTASARIPQRGRTRSKTQEFKGEEEKNGRSSSASLKCRSAAKFSDLRKGIGTVGANKSTEVLLTPKVLFKEVRSSLPSKLRSRVVASRYSVATTGSSRRKWSSPEPGKLANGGSVRSPVWIELGQIKTTGRTEGSPRNSGCVKRARDLVGRKSYFHHKALVF